MFRIIENDQIQLKCGHVYYITRAAAGHDGFYFNAPEYRKYYNMNSVFFRNGTIFTYLGYEMKPARYNYGKTENFFFLKFLRDNKVYGRLLTTLDTDHYAVELA